jgi:hypothetical protein
MLARRTPLTRRTPLRARRKPRPTGLVDEALLEEFRAKRRCEWCGRKLRHRPQPHHIFSRGAGRLDVRCNLIALGGAADCGCHDLVHVGKPLRRQLLAVAAGREGMTVIQAEQLVWRLRRGQRP